VASNIAERMGTNNSIIGLIIYMFSTCSVKPTSILVASAFVMVASPIVNTVVASTTSEDIFSNIDHSTHCGWLDDNTGNTSIETHDEAKFTIFLEVLV